MGLMGLEAVGPSQLSAGIEQNMKITTSSLSPGMYLYRVIVSMTSRRVMEHGKLTVVK